VGQLNYQKIFRTYIVARYLDENKKDFEGFSHSQIVRRVVSATCVDQSIVQTIVDLVWDTSDEQEI
jgi:hypothetical protein